MCCQKRQYLNRFSLTADGADYSLSCEGIAYSTILEIAGVFLFPMRIDELPLSNLDFSVHLLALVGSLYPRPPAFHGSHRPTLHTHTLTTYDYQFPTRKYTGSVLESDYSCSGGWNISGDFYHFFPRFGRGLSSRLIGDVGDADTGWDRFVSCSSERSYVSVGVQP